MSYEGDAPPAQMFLKHARPLIRFFRLVSFIPIFVDSNYEIRLSKYAPIQSWIGTFAGFAFPAQLCFICMPRAPFAQNLLTVVYIYARNFFPALTNAICLLRASEIYVGMHKTSTLGISFPVTSVWSSVIGTLAGSTIVLAAACCEFGPQISRRDFAFMLHSTHMVSLVVCICSLFGVQVHVLQKAAKKLNLKIFMLLENPACHEPDSIRLIMKKHQILHEIRSIINDAFGLPMLILLAFVFVKAIFCIAYYYEDPDMKRRIFSLSFGVLQAIPSIRAMHICQLLENEFKVTTDLMGKIKVKSVELSENIKSELLEWEVQLRQQRLAFSACGCFFLNAGQIQVGISTVVCYAVIIIQIS